MKYLPNDIRSFISGERTSHGLVLPVVILFVVCCLCSVVLVFVSQHNPPPVIPGPGSRPTVSGTQQTPTSLFNFNFPTFTPFGTLTPFPTGPGLTVPPTLTLVPSSTAFPTPTRLPTETMLPPTGTSLPTVTIPPATATTPASVVIIAVDKPAEYVDLQNFSSAVIDLRGWTLVSETGNQSCRLRGELQPGVVLRVWSRRGNPGFDCRFPHNIWNDNAADPAVLYNAQGEEVSRFP